MESTLQKNLDPSANFSWWTSATQKWQLNPENGNDDENVYFQILTIMIIIAKMAFVDPEGGQKISNSKYWQWWWKHSIQDTDNDDENVSFQILTILINIARTANAENSNYWQWW